MSILFSLVVSRITVFGAGAFFSVDKPLFGEAFLREYPSLYLVRSFCADFAWAFLEALFLNYLPRP